MVNSAYIVVNLPHYNYNRPRTGRIWDLAKERQEGRPKELPEGGGQMGGQRGMTNGRPEGEAKREAK